MRYKYCELLDELAYNLSPTHASVDPQFVLGIKVFVHFSVSFDLYIVRARITPSIYFGFNAFDDRQFFEQLEKIKEVKGRIEMASLSDLTELMVSKNEIERELSKEEFERRTT